MIFHLLFLLITQSFADNSRDLYPLTREQRDAYRVYVVKGKLIDANGITMDTRGPFGLYRFAPFIVQDGILYGVEFRDLDFIDHGNLSLGLPTELKGYWRIKQGIATQVLVTAGSEKSCQRVLARVFRNE